MRVVQERLFKGKPNIPSMFFDRTKGGRAKHTQESKTTRRSPDRNRGAF